MKSVSLREIQHNASAILAQVSRGQSFLVTRRKKTIALLKPVKGGAVHTERGSTRGIYRGLNASDSKWDGVESPLSKEEIKTLGDGLP